MPEPQPTCAAEAGGYTCIRSPRHGVIHISPEQLKNPKIHGRGWIHFPHGAGELDLEKPDQSWTGYLLITDNLINLLPPAEPEVLCGLCKHGRATTTAPVPVGTKDARHPLPLCEQCDGRLSEALFDLPWLRFVLSRYVPPTHGPGAPRWEWLNQ